ncbi:zinc ribbon domain-containing protein [Methanolapillus ohkumae]|uniref:Putative zinc ribbon domain-containing protein n=1 Tax=Methanolapillus ohkumae TaxID=3028298 RepID=A0AA96ZXX4_9EURY|nr:hypothetical protein MsAm2_13340 [Methanosarcinaceae archaeon Am2]
MSENNCQSCGMPMGDTDEMYGKNADGSKSKDYCAYCFEDGKFTADVSMADMIEICVPHMVTFNPDMTADAARKMMQEYYPHLKRWKK